MIKYAGAFVFLFPVFFAIAKAATFTIANDCPYTIWPGILAGAGSPDISPTGFRLEAGASYTVTASPAWSGRIWGRTGCDFDGDGNGVCQTGDCAVGLECKGRGAQPPATLFEITLGNDEEEDFYDVSLVDGYNLPMIVMPRSLDGGCNVTGCTTNLNSGCPKELQVVDGDVIACKSACGAFGLDQYCCSGRFASPTLCRPSYYSTIFKSACPTAYSYAFDDATSTFTCKAVDYTITFCPKIDRSRRANGVLNRPTSLASKQDNSAASSAMQLTVSSRLILIAIIISLSRYFDP
ncbi:unnamed protein product [Victoria cruziana]